MRATARRSRLQDSGLVARFGVAAHDGLVRQSALGAHRVRRLVDFLRQRLRTGQPEDVIDAACGGSHHSIASGRA